MSLKELYALCATLMCDDQKPIAGAACRNALVGVATRHAQSHGFKNWLDFYMQTEMPFTEDEVKADLL